MDFLKVQVEQTSKNGSIKVIPAFLTKTSKDLMIRGGDFYAIWDEEKGRWSTSQDDVIDLIDGELDKFRKEHPEYQTAKYCYMVDGTSGAIDRWNKCVKTQMKDNFHPLDETLVFANSPINKKDYSSKKLPYSLEPGDYSAWDELIGTLYSEPERRKIEWAIGSVVNGASKDIQKFLVFYGSAGTGKSTILNVIQELFEGYYTIFDAKALASNSESFALEPFKDNGLSRRDDR